MSTEKEREEIAGKLSAASTWLEDDGFAATTAVRGFRGPEGRAGALDLLLQLQKEEPGV